MPTSSDGGERLTLHALFAQPDNAAVLTYLGFGRPEDVRPFEAGTVGHAMDEGGEIFLHGYGRLVPPTARCRMGVSNVMAHERTARIFALHLGRFTVAIRPDFGRGDGEYAGPLRAETMDGEMDLRSLGPDWAMLFADSREEAAGVFLRAYELVGADPG